MKYNEYDIHTYICNSAYKKEESAYKLIDIYCSLTKNNVDIYGIST